jgi:hypothetical protein
MNCVEKSFKQKIEAAYNDRKVIIGRTGQSYQTLCRVGVSARQEIFVTAVARLVHTLAPMQVQCPQRMQQAILR